MKEEFLHYVWEQNLYDKKGLKTTDGLPVQIFDPGTTNSNSGPDFLEGRLRIGEIDWLGNIEIHVRSGDWYRHRHHHDPMYNSTILHVCLVCDRDVTRQDLSSVPCIELKGRIPAKVKQRYDQLKNNSHWIPCAPFLPQVKNDLIEATLADQGLRRMEEKANKMDKILKRCTGDWDEAFYIALAGGFGGNINRQPFTYLAEHVPLKLVRKHRHDFLSLEALLFGAGGFLRFLNEPIHDPYVQKLSERFRFLKHLHQIQPMDAYPWKFMRMRPANFPSVRLAQLCSVLHQNVSIFPMIRDNPELQYVRKFLDVKVSDYWEDHYVLNGNRSNSRRSMGDGIQNELIINVVVPFLYLYAERRGQKELKEHTIKMLCQIPAENNRIVREFKKLRVRSGNALRSQGMLQLYGKECTFKHCLNCPVGNQLLHNEEQVY